MAAKSPAYVPSMSNATVKARTGRDWRGWFEVLDRAGAVQLEHQAIVRILSEQHGVPSWWRQMVTVEYERARGLRARHETSRGFSVSVSKTIGAGLADLYAATASAPLRKKWLPAGKFAPSSQTRNKYFRGAWNTSVRVEMGFAAKGAGKAQIAIQLSKLASKADVERQRSVWQAALARLQTLLDKGEAAAVSARRVGDGRARPTLSRPTR